MKYFGWRSRWMRRRRAVAKLRCATYKAAAITRPRPPPPPPPPPPPRAVPLQRQEAALQPLPGEVGTARQDLGQRPDRHHAAALHDEHPGADLLDQVQQVRSEEHTS